MTNKYKINSKILVPYPVFDDFSDDVYADEFRIVGYGVNPNTYIIYDDRSNKKHAIHLGPKYDRWFKNRLVRSANLSDLDDGSETKLGEEDFIKRGIERNGKQILYEDRKKKPAKPTKRKPVKKCKCK